MKSQKYRLVPFDYDEQDPRNYKSRIFEILDNKKLDDSTRMQLYSDVLARFKNYQHDLKPPTVQIASVETPVAPVINYEVQGKSDQNRLEKILEKLGTNAAREIMTANETVHGSNVDDFLDYAFEKTNTKPYGYDKIVNLLQTQGITMKKRKPNSSPNIQQKTSQSTLNTATPRITRGRNKIKVEPSSSNSTPVNIHLPKSPFYSAHGQGKYQPRKRIVIHTTIRPVKWLL